VGEEEPCTEDGLGKNVEDGVGDDLLVNVHVAATVSNTPDAGKVLANAQQTASTKLTLGRRSR
jgi:hypothetical protein